MKIARSSAQRRLRLLLACTGVATGGAWGSVALALAHDHASASLLQGQAATAETVRIIVLLAALPLGALSGRCPWTWSPTRWDDGRRRWCVPPWSWSEPWSGP